MFERSIFFLDLYSHLVPRFFWTVLFCFPMLNCIFHWQTPPLSFNAQVLEKDFGHPSTRIEENARGLPVNVTSEEWTWKPNTYDEGIIEVESKLKPGIFYDTSGFFVDLPLNATIAKKKIYAMQYGRTSDGKVIASAAKANENLVQSKKTRFLSDQTVVLVVTVQAFNSGSGFIVHNNFVFEKSIVGEIRASHEALAGKLSSRECPDPVGAFTDVIGVFLGIGTIIYSILVLNDLRSGKCGSGGGRWLVVL